MWVKHYVVLFLKADFAGLGGGVEVHVPVYPLPADGEGVISICQLSNMVIKGCLVMVRLMLEV